MKYPLSLSSKLKEIKSIHESWNSSISFEDVVKWILQFDPDDYEIPLRIIKNLNFISFSDLRNGLSIAYSKLVRKALQNNVIINNKNTLFAGLGEEGKSGSMMSYSFRVINELSADNFENSSKYIESGLISNIVLIDDMVGTGRQAISEITKVYEELNKYGVFNIFLLSVCGLREGLEKIEKTTSVYTFAAFEYSKKDTIIDLDSPFYENLEYEQREKLLERIQEYGNICSNGTPLGFGKTGSLIAFEHNTPNISLPIIWSSQNSWIPLFKRATKISGIRNHYKQFEKSKKQKLTHTNLQQTEEQKREKKEISLIIFTDTKIISNFFTQLSQKFFLAEKLKLNGKIITLPTQGQNFDHKRTREIYSIPHGLFILEDSLKSQKMLANFDKTFKSYKVLDPNIFRLIDLSKMRSSKTYSDFFVKYPNKFLKKDYIKLQTEFFLFYESKSEEFIVNELLRFIDIKYYDKFVKEVFTVIKPINPYYGSSMSNLEKK